MPSSHLILCRPLPLLPPIPPSIRVFSNESALRTRWPKYWSFSFSISPSSEHSGLDSNKWCPDYHIRLFLFELSKEPNFDPTRQQKCGVKQCSLVLSSTLDICTSVSEAQWTDEPPASVFSTLLSAVRKYQMVWGSTHWHSAFADRIVLVETIKCWVSTPVHQ